MNNLFKCCLFYFLFSPLVYAGNAYPIITFTCDIASNVIKVKNEVKWGEEGKNFAYSAEDGTYNPWNWVKATQSGKFKKTNEVELSCQLSNGLYKIILQPKLFNTSPHEGCRKKISVAVTVFRGATLLLNQKPMEEFCRGNAPIIRGIKVLGKSGKVKLYRLAKHRFY